MKKYIFSLVALVVGVQICIPSFSYAANKTDNSTKQNPVCAAPWETMIMYLQFQQDALNAILWADIDEARLPASLSTEWLFTDKVLSLWTGSPAALDMATSGILWRARSLVSAWITTTLLLELTALSTVQSSTEWLIWILWQSRPIVREYKSLLNIETQFFNAAYYLSDKVNLNKPLDGNLVQRLKSLIKNYQDKWLLQWNWTIASSVTLSDVLADFVAMNASMKHFVLWGNTSSLRNFYGCMWNASNDDCSQSNAVLMFSGGAIDKLKAEYKWVRLFTNCDVSVSSIKSSFSNISHIWSSVKESWKEIKDAAVRLWNSIVRVGDPKAWKKWTRCDDLTYYELAQLRAYYWSNWDCEEWWDVQVSWFWEIISMKETIVDWMSNVWTFLQTSWNDMQDAMNNDSKLDNTLKDNTKNTKDKEQEVYDAFWSSVVYNPAFDINMLENFQDIFVDVKSEYEMAQVDAFAVDLTEQFIKENGLFEQIDELSRIMWNDSEWVQGELRKIEKYQCEG